MKNNTRAFIDHTFLDPKLEHTKLKKEPCDARDWDDEIYDWEYFGKEKYGRYAVCKNTGIKRGLTMGEFYGTSTVD